MSLKPQTIDNDIAYSDYSIGFDSSLEIVTNAIDALHTIAFSHNRVMIVEVMGGMLGGLHYAAELGRCRCHSHT